MTLAASAQRSPARRALHVMLGGFLGAGKTTAVARFAQWFGVRGLRVGLITNDQGRGLVDTTVLASRGFPVAEIAGGCFCCRFNSLVEAAQRLSQENRPDVFIAEPVGSCTDLVATVSQPLRALYGDRYDIAPLSVLVDPLRAMRVFGLQPGGRFTDRVLYVYRKQLEEADVIVLNKSDLLSPEQSAKLRDTLTRHFSRAQLFEVSARLGTGLEPWFDYVSRARTAPHAAMEVDYAIYGEGERRLGWFNATLRITAAQALEGNVFLHRLAKTIQQRLLVAAAQIAHLKMVLQASDTLGDLAVINLVSNDSAPELAQAMQDEFSVGRLTVNLRAETLPSVLRAAVEEALKDTTRARADLVIEWTHLETFQPAQPVPTHRLDRTE